MSVVSLIVSMAEDSLSFNTSKETILLYGISNKLISLGLIFLESNLKGSVKYIVASTKGVNCERVEYDFLNFGNPFNNFE